MLLNELSNSQTFAQSKKQAKRMANILHQGNDDRHNPQKAVRDPEDNSIRGPGGPHVNQPSREQAAAFLRNSGFNPMLPLDQLKKQIDLSALPEVSPNQDAARRRDYIPSYENNYSPLRHYGDGQRRISFGTGTQGKLWSAELVPYVKAFKKAFKANNFKAANKINSMIYKKFGMRIGGKVLRAESKSKKGFLNQLDEALGL